ncbi:unnamed protein product [Linum trigynum]|uniref:Uncharacterized protein n=1 Tax=Linum trigynum TaxID=586398 RepID=A0AAV2EZP0_9ROSI
MYRRSSPNAIGRRGEKGASAFSKIRMLGNVSAHSSLLGLLPESGVNEKLRGDDEATSIFSSGRSSSGVHHRRHRLLPLRHASLPVQSHLTETKNKEKEA